MLADAVVLGGGINGLAVIRSLGRRGIPVRLLTDDPNDIAAHSRYATVEQLSLRKNGVSAALAALAAHSGCGSDKPVLFFTSDEHLQLVTGNATDLAASYAFVAPTAEAADTVADKRRFASFAEGNGLPVPRTWPVGSVADVEALSSIPFPVVLKPDEAKRWKGLNAKILRVDDHPALVARYRAYSRYGTEMAVQELIAGPDANHYAFYSYRSADGTERASLTVQKPRVHPIHAGVGVYARVVHDAELERLGRATLDALGYVGASSVCFKVDHRKGDPLIHEVNGRLPAVHGAFAIAGIDLPYLMYADALGIDHAATSNPSAQGAWVTLAGDWQALRDYRRAGELSLQTFLRSYRDVKVCAEFARDDLAPFYAVVRRASRAMVRR